MHVHGVPAKAHPVQGYCYYTSKRDGMGRPATHSPTENGRQPRRRSSSSSSQAMSSRPGVHVESSEGPGRTVPQSAHPSLDPDVLQKGTAIIGQGLRHCGGSSSLLPHEERCLATYDLRRTETTKGKMLYTASIKNGARMVWPEGLVQP